METVQTKEATTSSTPNRSTVDGNSNMDSDERSDAINSGSATTSSHDVVSDATMVANNKLCTSVEIDNTRTQTKITAIPNKGGANIQRERVQK